MFEDMKTMTKNDDMLCPGGFSSSSEDLHFSLGFAAM